MTLLLFNNLYCVLSCLIQCAQPFATPWTIAHQAPLSMGFSRQEYWSGLTFPSPGELPDPGMKPVSPAQAELPGKPQGPAIRTSPCACDTSTAHSPSRNG